MTKTAITISDYEALDEKVENEIKEFLNKAYNHRWYIDTDVVMKNGYLARLVEINLKDGNVWYVDRDERSKESIIKGEMAFGEILNVLSCLPDEENFSRLNELLELDAKYNINEMLKKHPYHTDWGECVRFEIWNDAVRLANEYCIFDILYNVDDFINYVKDNTINDSVHADFLQLMTSIMELDDAESIWVMYGSRIIAELREWYSCEHYDGSDMRLVVSKILRERLLN